MNTPNTSSTITWHHWFVAAMLAALICGVSFGEESKVKTNDQRLLALCKNSEVTPEAIEILLKAGADVEARNERGLTPLMLAAKLSWTPEVFKVLLTAGAETEARNKGG